MRNVGGHQNSGSVGAPLIGAAEVDVSGSQQIEAGLEGVPCCASGRRYRWKPRASWMRTMRSPLFQERGIKATRARVWSPEPSGRVRRLPAVVLDCATRCRGRPGSRSVRGCGRGVFGMRPVR
jgi:hypothetical protein